MIKINKIKIGLDESGVGDYFGATVACAAVIFDAQRLKTIINIKDSKKFNDDDLNAEIYKITTDNKQSKYPDIFNFCLQEVPLKLYNDYLNQKQTKKLNAHHMKTYGHSKALVQLWNKLSLEQQKQSEITLDMFCYSQKHWENYQKDLIAANLLNQNEIVQIDNFVNKADQKYYEVSLSSMLARWEFLNQIKKISKQYNLKIPLGAGTNAKKLFLQLKQNNKEVWKKICKTHFLIKK